MSELELHNKLRDELLQMVDGVNSSVASRALNVAHLVVNGYMSNAAEKLPFRLINETSETN
ncbi:MAG: hypothetical protein WC156_14615 [Pedobacter sp.]